ncbi:MAG: hypothetical protein ACM3UZ_04945 [Acidobacteriota bacterium]
MTYDKLAPDVCEGRDYIGRRFARIQSANIMDTDVRFIGQRPKFEV